MKLLFLHPNFPGQFKNLAAAFAAKAGYQVVGVGHRSSEWRSVPGVKTYHYGPLPAFEAPPYMPVDQFAQQVRRGHAVAAVLRDLAQDGFSPDVVIAHPGWGDAMFLHDVFPRARLIAFLEFYYQHSGTDLDFDPEFPPSPNETEFLRLRNLPSVMAYEVAAAAVSPTAWQASLFPRALRCGITVHHEGVDTNAVCPDPAACVTMPSGRVLTRHDEVVTYVARGLEPMRGFHSFMRALPEIQRQRPDVVTIIVGSDEVHYGRRPQGKRGWREVMLAEVGAQLDMERIWFAGRLGYGEYLNVLRVSSVHVYLTYPFVLSWSLVEAMAAGCAIVGSNTAPVAEVITDGENGVLCDFFHRERLAEMVSTLVGDRELRLQLGARARLDAVEKFDFRRVALLGYESLIERALGAAPDTGANQPAARGRRAANG
ncbi:glycosyltransferase [Oleomonas cavernae]|uniref:Glycosyltransferase n=1 Tax=Oleomonas cavernae TaxID=2320859 RepID=A0A418W8X3_9PROT|nr:glycosyltransferase [Oleomonas cavernae]RJF86446.1 glycosyltransferase [Oleomonas cavernae]